MNKSDLFHFPGRISLANTVKSDRLKIQERLFEMGYCFLSHNGKDYRVKEKIKAIEIHDDAMTMSGTENELIATKYKGTPRLPSFYTKLYKTYRSTIVKGKPSSIPFWKSVLAYLLDEGINPYQWTIECWDGQVKLFKNDRYCMTYTSSGHVIIDGVTNRIFKNILVAL